MYIYPPRPKNKIPYTGLLTFESMFVGQPKLNGSCGVLFLTEDNVKLMNRHKDTFSRHPVSPQSFQSLHRGSGEMVITGEYLNKSQCSHKGDPLRGFVIFDILKFNDKHLIGTTQAERMELLQELYETSKFDGFIRKIDDTENAFIVKEFSSLSETWDELVKIEMYEGLVLKLPSGKLKKGTRPNNNSDWQLKCRKPTKNYQY